MHCTRKMVLETIKRNPEISVTDITKKLYGSSCVHKMRVKVNTVINELLKDGDITQEISPAFTGVYSAVKKTSHSFTKEEWAIIEKALYNRIQGLNKAALEFERYDYDTDKLNADIKEVARLQHIVFTHAN